METRRLGQGDVAVSRVIVGCGNFGGVGSAPALFGQGTPKDEAMRILDAAWDLGITTLDTADAYGGGRSETWIGEWLATKGSEVRDRVTIQTKTFNPMDVDADRGLSRARIERQIDTSLERLGVERVAVYMAHDHDPDVPQEETLQAFAALVQAGKIGAVGVSNYGADQLAEALELTWLEGLPPVDVVQNSFSLLDQADRETVFPLLHEHGIAYEPFGPLAGGWLTGKYAQDRPPPAGSRMTQRPDGYRKYEADAVYEALDALRTEAALRGVTMAALALAWLLHLDEVTAVVIGPNRVEHLDDVRAALALPLDEHERARIGALFA